MGTYQRCRTPTKNNNKLYDWISMLSMMYALQPNFRCAWMRFFFFSDRTNEKKTSPNHSNGSQIEKEKETIFYGRWKNEQKTLWWNMMAVVGLWCVFYVCVSEYRRLFSFSFRKNGHYLFVKLANTYIRMFVCLLARFDMHFIHWGEWSLSLSFCLCVRICLSICPSVWLSLHMCWSFVFDWQ